MAPTSSSIKVGTERIGRALDRNVILSNRVLGIVEYPLLPIAASGRCGESYLPEAALSQRTLLRKRGCRQIVVMSILFLCVLIFLLQLPAPVAGVLMLKL
jgi:hypothetical protein